LRFFRLNLHWKKKLNKALKLADWVILTVYSLGSFLKTHNNDLNLIIFFFPVPVVILPRIIFFRKQTSFFRIALWAQLFLLTLRIDEIINFSWYLVFIIGFGLCAVFIGRICHLGIRIHKKKKLLKELPEEVHFRLIRIKILGIIYNLLMSGYSLIFILFFFGLAQRLETGENSVVLGVTLILTMIYSVLLIYISLKYKYEITRSIISKIIQNDPDHIKIKEILRKELEVGITRKSAPRYLVKMSPTYYQVAKPVKSKLEKKLTKINFVTVGDIDAKKEEDDDEDNEQEDQKENSQQQCDDESKSNEVSKSEEEEKSKDDESDIQEDEAQHEEEEDKSQAKDQDDENCFICCERKPNSVIMECGHGGVCYQCGLEMWKKEEKCYLCRQKITRLLKLEDIEEDNDLAKVQVAITFNKNKQININESFQDVLNDI